MEFTPHIAIVSQPVRSASQQATQEEVDEVTKSVFHLFGTSTFAQS